jgi:hypothetical protein
MLSVGASFAITAREIFLGKPILEHPLIDETGPFSQTFGIRNRMSFFTMHDTCSIAIVESEILDSPSGVISNGLRYRLGDIRPDTINYMEKPVIGMPGKPVYGSFTFFVRYYINIFGVHWARDFYVDTCQWILQSKVMWECPGNTPTIFLVPQLKKALERCN